MDIYEALQRIPKDKAEYFKWKFNLEYDKTKQKKTEEEFLKKVEKKTLNAFLKWEKTIEYKALVRFYLTSRLEDDQWEIYNKITEQAKEGDVQSSKEFRQMKKEFETTYDELIEAFEQMTSKDEEDDE